MSNEMNALGRAALTYYESHAPAFTARIPDPERHFRALGNRMEALIELRTEELCVAAQSARGSTGDVDVRMMASLATRDVWDRLVALPLDYPELKPVQLVAERLSPNPLAERLVRYRAAILRQQARGTPWPVPLVNWQRLERCCRLLGTRPQTMSQDDAQRWLWTWEALDPAGLAVELERCM